ncbi:MAG: BrnT family toxin [Deltaproteobacteria bacterium]|nr:BrnT family toxin [Deltaproteobacteria bacterium]
MKFVWDDRKAEANKSKHGISFEEAITAFDDPCALRAPDEKHSTPTETREWLIGEADTGHVLVVVFTERLKKDVYRIISARRASRRERRLYENS